MVDPHQGLVLVDKPRLHSEMSTSHQGVLGDPDGLLPVSVSVRSYTPKKQHLPQSTIPLRAQWAQQDGDRDSVYRVKSSQIILPSAS